MLLQSLRVVCFATGGPGSICKYFEAFVWLTGVSRKVDCVFQTDLHCADVIPSSSSHVPLPKFLRSV